MYEDGLLCTCEQVDQETRFVPLCVFWPVESIGASQQVASEDDGVDVLLSSDGDEPVVDRPCAVYVRRGKDPHGRFRFCASATLRDEHGEEHDAVGLRHRPF